jgi:hypothetical protein
MIMPLSSGQDQILRAIQAYNPGRVGSRGLVALLDSMKDVAAAYSLPDIKTAQLTDLTTIQMAYMGTGVLYGVFATSNIATLSHIVLVSDGATAIHLAALKVPPRIASGVRSAAACFFWGDTTGVGVPIATDLRCTAFSAADGTTAAAAGLNVTLYYGT